MFKSRTKILKKRIDLTGKKFGRLTVIKQDGYFTYPNGRKSLKWICKCNCGNEITINGSALTTGHTKSCGCLARETTSKCRRKYNTYDLSGEYGIGYTSKGEEFYFDLEDYNKLKDYYWRINNNNYVFTQINSDSQSINIFMHRIVILDFNNIKNTQIDIDHINHNERDNRKVNLRIATRSQNNQNRTMSKRNKSGFVGVFQKRNFSKWTVYLSSNNKRIQLGQYSDFTEAVKARIEAERDYFGNYAYVKHQKVLDYINNGNKLEPYNQEMIENIMMQEDDERNK